MATRFGVAPRDRTGAEMCGSEACPDILSLSEAERLDLAREVQGISSGPMVAVIGSLATREQIGRLDLPDGASVADYEGVVLVPQRVLQDAAQEMQSVIATAI
jgi:hypothetical protein